MNQLRFFLFQNKQVLLYLFFNVFTFPCIINAQTITEGKSKIDESKFVKINGIEQWISIKGTSTKPLILFIHGGPGSTISPYAHHLYKEWENDFLIVQWDQRGAGKTYGRNAPEELTPEFLASNPLSLETMTNDGIILCEYLLHYLKKQKLILLGTSWGSLLGIKMAAKRPEFFYAYIGHSQIVEPTIDLAFYNRVYKIAEQKNDKEGLEILNKIGKPPYDRANKCGLLLRVSKKHEKENVIPPPENWFIAAAEYNSEKDIQNRNDGDDYSFLNFVGDNKLGVPAMSANINLLKDNVEFKIPVFFIQGEEDILTTKETTKSYFNKIIAPEKQFFLLPNTAHGFNELVLTTQFKILKKIKVF